MEGNGLGEWGQAASGYLDGGWYPFPLPEGKKHPPPVGYTGHEAHAPSTADLWAWDSENGNANLGIAMPDGVVGIDVDAYKPEGAATWADLVDSHGPPPPTYVSSAREAPSGIRFYRVPKGLTFVAVLGHGVEIIQPAHRYACVWPSTQNAGSYSWRFEGGPPLDHPPDVDDLPWLTGEWVAVLRVQPMSKDSGDRAPLTGGTPCRAMGSVLLDALAGLADPSRHDAMTNGVMRLVRLGEQGHAGSKAALVEFAQEFQRSVKDRATSGESAREFKRALDGARVLVARTPTLEIDKGCCPTSGDMPHTDEQHARPVYLIEIEAEIMATQWLWENWLPKGELCLLAGREGLGKSTVAYTLAAKVTRGTLPGIYAGTPRRVVLAITEDDIRRTVTPRLMGAGADLRLVSTVQVGPKEGYESLSFPLDLPALESEIRRVGDVGLLVLDPLTSRIGTRLDTHKDSDVRRALEPLAALAHRLGICVLGIIHQNKGDHEDALQTIMGSAAFSATCRSVVMVGRDPDNSAKRVMGLAKSNLGPVDGVESISFHIEGRIVGQDSEGVDVVTAVVIEDGTDHRSYQDLHTDARQARKEAGPSQEAARAAMEILYEKGEIRRADLIPQIVLEAGVSKRTAERVLAALRDQGRTVERIETGSDRKGVPYKWVWISRADRPPTVDETVDDEETSDESRS